MKIHNTPEMLPLRKTTRKGPFNIAKTAALLALAQHGANASRDLFDGPGQALRVSGKNINLADGSPLEALVGLNVVDTRGCGAYGPNEVSVTAQLGLLDFALDTMNIGIVRYNLESDTATGTALSTFAKDPAYRARQLQIIDHLGAVRGHPVLVSLWIAPSEMTDGAPTADTDGELVALALAANTRPWMMIGVANENHPKNPSAATDADIRSRMQHAVNVVRQYAPNTIISVGTPRGYNADVSPAYEAQPLIDPQNSTAPQIIYGLHLYGSEAQVNATLAKVSSSALPYFVEEAGPTGETVDGQSPPYPDNMTYKGFCSLLAQARNLDLPVLAWVFGPQGCFPSMTRPVGTASVTNGQVQFTPWGELMAAASHAGACPTPTAPPTVPPTTTPPATVGPTTSQGTVEPTSPATVGITSNATATPTLAATANASVPGNDTAKSGARPKLSAGSLMGIAVGVLATAASLSRF